MLARIINELAGLPLGSETEEDSDGDEFMDAHTGFTPTAAQADAAHLTAGPGATPPQAPQQQPPPPPMPDARRGRWSSIMDATRRIIDSVVYLGDSDEEGDDGASASGSDAPRSRSGSLPPPRPRPSGGPTTVGFPTTARSTSTSELDLEALGDTTAPTAFGPPEALPPLPALSEPSALMEERHIRALLAEVPLRYRQASWRLAYSTLRDGISLATLLRNARGAAPTVLVVRDMGRAVFGAFCSEAWRVAPRYFGTGETFVFSLAPRESVWHWWWKKGAQHQNDYFMWSSGDCVAVGGAGGYALWLDAELATGLSRTSLTFGNDPLASAEEFRVGAVELWALE